MKTPIQSTELEKEHWYDVQRKTNSGKWEHVASGFRDMQAATDSVDQSPVRHTANNPYRVRLIEATPCDVQFPCKFEHPDAALIFLEKRGFRIKNGLIRLNPGMTPNENSAVDYLCSEWDYSVKGEIE
jgi:hypothetical protein